MNGRNGRTGKHRGTGRIFHRGIAFALGAVLLTGQLQLPVSAQEEQTEDEVYSEEEAFAGEEVTAPMAVPVALEPAEMEAAAPEAGQDDEPKTGGPVPVEIYATIAMVAGLTYVLLYFIEEGRGMTEREKEVYVAAFIRWAKKGGRFRKGCAVAAIFCILVYYHAVGKRSGERTYPQQA